MDPKFRAFTREIAITRRELLVAGAALSAWPARAQAADPAIVPFKYRASDAALENLKQRLDEARWPERETGEGWEQGPPLAALRGLVDYWLTNTAASSARFYLEQVELLGKHNNPGRVDLPVGVSVFPNDLPPARSWAPLVYPKLFYWHELDRGGHFAQLEVPELFTEEIRRCLRGFRRT